MDIWHKFGRIFRRSNLGTLIFFGLNIFVIFSAFGSSGDAGVLIMIYTLTVIVSLSPIGEWALCMMVGAEDIKRKDIKIHIIPLVEVVLDSAKKNSLYCPDSVNIKIIRDQTPNAFALGRKTIAITDGLLRLPDEAVMAVLAHEIGHLAYGHTVIQLLIGGGNVFITFFLLLLKISCWIFAAIMGIFSFASRSWIMGIMTAIFSAISYGAIWLWVKFCKIFLMWSMRQNEFVADEYAMKLGFGYELAYSLDHELYSIPRNGFLNALFDPHPSSDDRIAALQNLGVNYSRY